MVRVQHRAFRKNLKRQFARTWCRGRDLPTFPGFNNQTRQTPGASHLSKRDTGTGLKVSNRRMSRTTPNATPLRLPLTNHLSLPCLPRPSVSQQAVHEQLERVIKHDRQKNQTQIRARAEYQDC